MVIKVISRDQSISATENWRAVRWLTKHSERPLVAVKLWAVLWVVRNVNGDIDMTREQLAEIVGTTPPQISRVMGELESLGAISRRREPVRGTRGAGVVVYTLHAGARFPI